MTGLITIPQAAKLLGINERSARREVKRTNSLAGIPVIQINGRNRVSAEQIQKLLKGEAA